jgi:hypothetical protein
VSLPIVMSSGPNILKTSTSEIYSTAVPSLVQVDTFSYIVVFLRKEQNGLAFHRDLGINLRVNELWITPQKVASSRSDVTVHYLLGVTNKRLWS